MHSFRTAVIGIALAGVALGSVPAAAAVRTFASFVPVNGGVNLSWTLVGTDRADVHTIAAGGTTAVDYVPVNFTFGGDLSALGPLSALFFFEGQIADPTPAGVDDDYITQNALQGTMSFIYSGVDPLIYRNVSYAPGTNLLAAAFSQGVTGGIFGATQATMIGGSSGDATVSYSSDILRFDVSTDRIFSLELSDIATGFTTAGADKAVDSFSSRALGSFDASGVLGPLPEPATWTMMIIGFGLVGVGMRRRRVGATA